MRVKRPRSRCPSLKPCDCIESSSATSPTCTGISSQDQVPHFLAIEQDRDEGVTKQLDLSPSLVADVFRSKDPLGHARQSRKLPVDPRHHLGEARLCLDVSGVRGGLSGCHQGEAGGRTVLH